MKTHGVPGLSYFSKPSWTHYEDTNRPLLIWSLWPCLNFRFGHINPFQIEGKLGAAQTELLLYASMWTRWIRFYPSAMAFWTLSGSLCIFGKLDVNPEVMATSCYAEAEACDNCLILEISPQMIALNSPLLNFPTLIASSLEVIIPEPFRMLRKQTRNETRRKWDSTTLYGPLRVSNMASYLDVCFS